MGEGRRINLKMLQGHVGYLPDGYKMGDKTLKRKRGRPLSQITFPCSKCKAIFETWAKLREHKWDHSYD